MFGGEFRAVEFFREFEQRLVPVQINVLQNGARPLFNHGVKKTGAGGKLAEFRGKILVGVADNFHAGRLEDEELKVKTLAGRMAGNPAELEPGNFEPV